MTRRKCLVFIGALLILLLTISFSYSYYVAEIKVFNNTETIIKTKELNLVFTGTSEITASNMIPGDSFTKTFTVENTSDVETSYNIYMEKVTNEFNEDLVYTLSDETGEVVEETPLPVTNESKSYLLSNIEIAAKIKKEYTLKIEFKYLNTPQNGNQGAEFKAILGIDANKVELIKVTAVDSSGKNLNATATNITGEERENLLASLEETGYITSSNEVDALIEVESEKFEDLATTTFDVSEIANTGDTVVILHYNEETKEWEYIGTEIVDTNGKVTGDFTSYSPVAFVVVKEDGSFESLVSSSNIVAAYAYNQTSGASNYCITGDEGTCVSTRCYESKVAESCASGTIVDYKVNDADIVRFHVMYDNGNTLTVQSQRNTIYNTAWINKEDYADKISCSYDSCYDEGPLTALNSLENKTSTWKNVNNQTYTMGTTVFKTNAYTGCTSKDCTVSAYALSERTAKARMITVQEANVLGCTDARGSCPIWMYNYLSSSTNYGGIINDTTTENSGISNNGYWTMSANTTISSNVRYAWRVSYYGSLMSKYTYDNDIGIRAVVNVSK